MNKRHWALAAILVLYIYLPSCKGGGSGGSMPETKGTLISSDSLKLKPDMKIKLSQRAIAADGQLAIGKPNFSRTLNIESPPTQEGLSFAWDFKTEAPLPEINWAKDNPAPTPSAQTAPAPPTPSLPLEPQSGRMTLANLVAAKGMTLPNFWPAGELYLSDTSAVWLSDRAFSDLKKTQKAQWQPGLVGNTLLGPAQGIPLLEKLLQVLNQNIQRDPETLKSAGEIATRKKSVKHRLKVNGEEREVQAIEAGNWLASYRILDNAQNPLILEVVFNPAQTPAGILFSPLTLLKPMLEYRVEEIWLPSS